MEFPRVETGLAVRGLLPSGGSVPSSLAALGSPTRPQACWLRPETPMPAGPSSHGRVPALGCSVVTSFHVVVRENPYPTTPPARLSPSPRTFLKSPTLLDVFLLWLHSYAVSYSTYLYVSCVCICFICMYIGSVPHSVHSNWLMNTRRMVGFWLLIGRILDYLIWGWFMCIFCFYNNHVFSTVFIYLFFRRSSVGVRKHCCLCCSWG